MILTFITSRAEYSLRVSGHKKDELWNLKNTRGIRIQRSVEPYKEKNTKNNDEVNYGFKYYITRDFIKYKDHLLLFR
jgi:hypothetical protein